MEAVEDTAHRARRRVIAARTHRNVTWQDVFTAVDTQQNGELSFSNFKSAVRLTLAIPARTICDYDIKALFNCIDADKSGTIDLSEMLEYLAQGPKRKEDEIARAHLRVTRAKKNLKMAFQQACAPTEAEIRKIFKQADIDGDGKMSPYEFKQFCRDELQLSVWDCPTSNLDALYGHLDQNDDGISIEELIRFIRQNDRDRNKQFSFVDTVPSSGSPSRRRLQTYRQRIIEETMPPAMKNSISLPSLKPSVSMVSIGRERGPTYRGSLAMSSIMFFQPDKFGGK